MDTETTFFESDDIAITNARFIVGEQTFVMRNITSVEVVKIPANHNRSVALAVVAALAALAGFSKSLFVLAGLGVLFLAIGIWMAARQKPTFQVVLRTAGGEVSAYESYDSHCIAEIVGALNRSIVSRG